MASSSATFNERSPLLGWPAPLNYGEPEPDDMSPPPDSPQLRRASFSGASRADQFVAVRPDVRRGPSWFASPGLRVPRNLVGLEAPEGTASAEIRVRNLNASMRSISARVDWILAALPDELVERIISCLMLADLAETVDEAYSFRLDQHDGLRRHVHNLVMRAIRESADGPQQRDAVELILSRQQQVVSRYLQQHALIARITEPLPRPSIDELGRFYPAADKAARHGARLTLKVLWAFIAAVNVVLFLWATKTAFNRHADYLEQNSLQMDMMRNASNAHRIPIFYECAGGEPLRLNSTNCGIYFPNCFVYPVTVYPCKNIEARVVVNTLLDPTCAGFLSACESVGDFAQDIAPLIAILVGLCVIIPCISAPADERVARPPYEFFKRILRVIMIARAQKAAGRDDAMDALAIAGKEEAEDAAVRALDHEPEIGDLMLVIQFLDGHQGLVAVVGRVDVEAQDDVVAGENAGNVDPFEDTDSDDDIELAV